MSEMQRHCVSIYVHMVLLKHTHESGEPMKAAITCHYNVADGADVIIL